MDKFDRRASKRDQVRNLGRFALAFTVVAVVAAALPVLGPRVPTKIANAISFGSLWFFGIGYGLLGVGVAVIAGYNAGLLKLRWLRQPTAFQPIQGPGFTALELAAFNELLSHFPSIADALREQWMRAVVSHRVNTGHGCLTRLVMEDLLQSSVEADVSRVSSLWWVSTLSNPVSCTFWSVNGHLGLVELSTDLESSDHVDWAAAPFDLLNGRVANSSQKIPPVAWDAPLSPPLHRPLP